MFHGQSDLPIIGFMTQVQQISSPSIVTSLRPSLHSKGVHQVATANNCCVNAEGSGTITLYLNKPNEKPAMIILHHVHDVPVCGTNILRSIIQLMEKCVNLECKLNEATASHLSVLDYDAPLINILLILRASNTSASVSKASVSVDDPLSTTLNSEISEMSKAFSKLRPGVDDKDMPISHALLNHLSLRAIKRLPNAVRGITLHPKCPLTFSSEVCIMGKMFRKPFKPSEHKANSRLLELTYFDVIGPIQTQSRCG